MKLNQILREALPEEKQREVVKRLVLLSSQPGEAGYHARMLRYALCEDEPTPEEEP